MNQSDLPACTPAAPARLFDSITGLLPVRRRPTVATGAGMVLAICGPILISGCDESPHQSSGVRRVFGAVGMGRGEFQYPRVMAASPIDGCLFIIDKAARVQRFSADGQYEHEWRMPEWSNGKPTGACVDNQGRVLIADTHYARVIAYDRDGNELLRFGHEGNGPGEFIWPCSVAAGRDGSIYVGEYGGNDRISKFSAHGRFLTSFAHGDESLGGITRPQGLCVDPDGTLWAADAGHHRICHYSPAGEFLGAFGSMGDGPTQFRFPYDVSPMPDGTLIICDYGNNRLVRTTRNGHAVGLWGGTGRAPGQLVHPWSIEPGKGVLFVLDSWNSRVQVVAW